MPERFVDLSTDRGELLLMLQGLNLARHGDQVATQMLTGGVSSNIFRVDLPSGPLCVKQALPKLKVEKDWHAPTSRVLAEIDWLSTAQEIAPGRVPRVLGADRERGAFAMEFLSGLANWKNDLLRGQVDLAVGEQVAAVLGRIHRATARNAEIETRFAYDANFFALRLEPYLVEAARAHPDLARQLISLVQTTQTTPLALVHGDVSPKNILLGVDGPFLLDAECAWYGDPAFDLAFLLNHVLLKAAHLPRCAAKLHELYGRITATYMPCISWEGQAEFERRCALLLPSLLLARIDGKSPVEYLSEVARSNVRAVARHLLLQPRATLLDVLVQWQTHVPATP